MYPTRVGSKPAPQDVSLNDRARELTGEEGKSSNKAAVTRASAALLGAVSLQSKILSSAPTAADYNALVNDIRTIVATLNAMGANINT